jgi:hypothetical protein
MESVSEGRCVRGAIRRAKGPERVNAGNESNGPWPLGDVVSASRRAFWRPNRTIGVRERAFLPTELVLLFRLAGMDVLHLWGGTAGRWGKRSLDLDEMEIMIVARKAGEHAAESGTGSHA